MEQTVAKILNKVINNMEDLNQYNANHKRTNSLRSVKKRLVFKSHELEHDYVFINLSFSENLSRRKLKKKQVYVAPRNPDVMGSCKNFILPIINNL